MTALQVEHHNSTVLSELEPGDMVEFKRGLYSHWAVFIGDGKVVHLRGEDNDGINNVDSGSIFTVCGRQFSKAFVGVDDFWSVTLTSKAYKNNEKDKKCLPYTGPEIVERALGKLGHIGYNVLWQNCEHFAAWCRYDKEWSEQVRTTLTWFALGTAAVGGIAILLGLKKASKQNKDDKETKE